MNQPINPSESPTQSETADFSSPPVNPSPASGKDHLRAIPERIGRYKVEKILGQGGFGLVYLALDEQLDRRVAIKVPHAKLVAQAGQAEAYLTEARTVAKLDHPQIVPVYDVGTTEQFPCFVVSKFIDGTDLAARIKQGRLAISQTVELVGTVAEALHYAHKQGLVHRDIKPGNILLDKSGRPFVGDFGLALREQDIGKGPRFAGTPAYMSPEQARGEGHRVDGRSDVFSLGVVLYQLLVNRLPFRAESQLELLEQISNFEPKPLRQYDETIDRELERICCKAMAKRSSERFSTAKDFAEDLRHFLGQLKAETPARGYFSGPTNFSTLASSRKSGPSNQRALVVRSTFFFADFKGFNEKVRLLEKTAGHQAAAEMNRKVATYIDETFRLLENEIKQDQFTLIATGGDDFFYHFVAAKDAVRFAQALHQLTRVHNASNVDELAEHWFRTGAATGDVAWDDGKPVGQVVNVGSRLQSASQGGDLVIDRCTFDDLPPEMQKLFGPGETIQDKEGQCYEVYRTGFGRPVAHLPAPTSTALHTPYFAHQPTHTPSFPQQSDSQLIRIVPKGLRSFDANDADFFLELLPGPRDRDGLPDSIRFWKNRIESTDSDQSFLVGLIYGPSGCGKSSLVKAGLLPRLSDSVTTLYIEATGEETEIRLLRGLRKRFPRLPIDLGLKETLTALRQGNGVPPGKKILIVLDQFEQWLHAKKEEGNTELVQALRQCDSSRVQAIVMVRDDFWLAVSRFLRDLDIRLVDGQNSSMVDLFPIRHAEKVLAAFGRAFGIIGEKLSDFTKEQKQFVEQAVTGLAQEGKVISVRLAIFSEMMKGKDWNPGTLKSVGGTEGVGAAFLEETFSAESAPAEHRYRQKAVRGVLKALLSESGTDIKGVMRSHEELLIASGYQKQPNDFEELLQILDNKIRLITPTDPEGKEGWETSPNSGNKFNITPTVNPAFTRYFQLAHDYLVPSIREWLRRKQKESAKGRAEVLMEERTAFWKDKKLTRHLPSFPEYLRIAWYTKPFERTQIQREMVGQAGWIHGTRTVGFLFLVGFVSFLGFEGYQRFISQKLVEKLATAEPAQIEGLVREIQPYASWADGRLESIRQTQPGTTQALAASLALLPRKPELAWELAEKLTTVDNDRFRVLASALKGHSDGPIKEMLLSGSLEEKDADKRFRKAAALVVLDPDGPTWDKITDFLAEYLTGRDATNYLFWRKQLANIGPKLVPSLGKQFRDPKADQQVRSFASEAVVEYSRDKPDTLFGMMVDSPPKFYPKIQKACLDQVEACSKLAKEEIAQPISDKLPENQKDAQAMRKANAAIFLLKANQADQKLWDLWKLSSDPRIRSEIIHDCPLLEIDPGILIKRLEQETETSTRRALVLSLGSYPGGKVPENEKTRLSEIFLKDFATHPDGGYHSALEWTLRQWGQEKRVDAILKELAGKYPKNTKEEKDWLVTSLGITFVVVKPGSFTIGSPDTESGRAANEERKTVRIPRPFLLAHHEVTRALFRQFEKEIKRPLLADKKGLLPYFKTELDPQTGIDWYDAARFCNWLSEKEGIPKEEWCYEPVKVADPTKDKTGGYREGMSIKANHRDLSGYRLPLEAEWEFACRATTNTSRYYGNRQDLLGQYAWFADNSNNHLWPVQSLKPNDWGLFDMLGNAYEWCSDIYQKEIPEGEIDRISRDSRLLRSGAFSNPAVDSRSAFRDIFLPDYRANLSGFRPCRTYDLKSLQSHNR